MLFKSIKKIWKNLGPGLVTGAADDDPSGIATYSQTGASYGLSLIWLSLFTFPLMSVVQEMCARIGIVTGLGLSKNLKKIVSKKVLFLIVVMLGVSNILNIAADLNAMSEATRLIFPGLDFYMLIFIFAVFIVYTQIFVTYKTYSQYLKFTSITLFSYIICAVFVHVNWTDLLAHTLIPQLNWSKDQIVLICAILGTTISPYLFFWQPSQEVEEEILSGEKTLEQRVQSVTDESISKMRLDVWVGMFFSNIVMFFIILVCANTLFANGITNVDSAAAAAKSLQPLAGNFAYLLFSFGIISTGLLAIPVLAGSLAYAVSEFFDWKTGLYKTWSQARKFYSTIAFSVFLAVLINFIRVNSIKMLIYSAIVNGIIAPVIILFIIFVGSSEKIMGKYKNGFLTNTFGYLIFFIMLFISLYTIYLSLFN